MALRIEEIVDRHIRSGRVKLPVLNDTGRKLQEMLRSREIDITAIEELAAQDPVLTGALLELSNSTFYGGMQKVTNVREATMRLGATQVAQLGSVVTQKGNFAVRTLRLRPMLRQLWEHAVAAATGTQWLVEKIGHPELSTDAFTLGMVHDIGRLVVLRAVDELIKTRPNFAPPAERVLAIMDDSHAEHGSRLVAGWGSGDALVRWVTGHHAEPGSDDDLPLRALRFVDLACLERGIGLRRQSVDLQAEAERNGLELDRAALASLREKLDEALQLAKAG